jgi:hypothetical protein
VHGTPFSCPSIRMKATRGVRFNFRAGKSRDAVDFGVSLAAAVFGELINGKIPRDPIKLSRIMLGWPWLTAV